MFSHRHKISNDYTAGSRDSDRSISQRKIIPDAAIDSDIKARIFLGVVREEISREALYNHFSKWGTVIGVTIAKNNCGFVQFSAESEAQACLSAGIFTYINDIRIKVQPTRLGSGAKRGPYPSTPAGRTLYNDIQSNGPQGKILPSARRNDNYVNYYSSKPENNQKRKSFDSTNRYRNQLRIDYREETSRERENGYGGCYSPSARVSALSVICNSDTPDHMDPNRPNDVEIVVLNKLQRDYAERIEARLKSVGLLVDLLFPPAEISNLVLSDLSSRKCPFAITITPENEEHNSVTLNILQGETQEHRNMPVEDALYLVQQNFTTLSKKNSERNMRHEVPPDIRHLLHDLIEMRALSMGDLDKLIKYLKQRQNSLVDDQIKQKRETAGTQPTAVARSLSVTYPGYNYLTTTVPANVNMSTASHSTLGAPLASIGIVQTAPMAAQASAYTRYGTVSAIPPTAVLNAYSLAGP